MPAASARCCRDDVVRLILVLKAPSLSRGASGVQRETVLALQKPGRCRSLSLHPVEGFGRRVGRSRAAGAYGRAADRRRRGAREGRDRSGRQGAGDGRSEAADARARRKASRCSTARRSRPRWRSRGLFEIEKVFAAAHRRRRDVDRCAEGLRHAVRCAHPCAARAAGPDRCRRGAARLDGGQRNPRIPSRARRRRQGAGPVFLPLPAAGDGRGARSDARRRAHAADRGHRRHRQSAGVQRNRRSSPAAISTPSRSPSPPISSRWRCARSATSPNAAPRSSSIRR